MTMRSAPSPNWLGLDGLTRFSLRVGGYEFPGLQSSSNEYDANWLFIHGVVEHGTDRWAFHHPCLLVEELDRLITWVGSLPKPTESAASFIEPLISFEEVTGKPWHVRVILRGEAVPPLLPEFNERWRGGRSLTIQTNPSNRDAFVDLLASDLSRHPSRWTGSS